MAGIDLKLFKMTNEEFQRGIAIENYEGTLSLVSAQSNDRGIWKDWVFPQVRQDGVNVARDKAIPLKLVIGKSKQEAIKTLQFFISALNGDFEDPKPEDTPPEPPEDDLPF